MPFRRRARSRDLSEGAVVLRPVRSAGAMFVRGLFLLAVLGAGGGAAVWYVERNFVPAAQHEQLIAAQQGLELDKLQLQAQLRDAEEDSQAQRDKLQRAGLDLEIAAVTRMELERQLVVLNEQLKQVQEELEFIKTAGGDKR